MSSNGGVSGIDFTSVIYPTRYDELSVELNSQEVTVGHEYSRFSGNIFLQVYGGDVAPPP